MKTKAKDALVPHQNSKPGTKSKAGRIGRMKTWSGHFAG
jgi:hypothetical protein